MKITAQQALERILNTDNPSGMKKTRGVTEEFTPVLKHVIKTRGSEGIYIFQDSENTAVLASADSSLPAVIGRMQYNEEEGLSPEFRSFLVEESESIISIQEAEEEEPSEDPVEILSKAPMRASTDSEVTCPDISVKGLLGNIAWHQRRPFCFKNQFKRRYNEEIKDECIVGCPTTALGQVIRYASKHGASFGCVGRQSYYSKKKLDDDSYHECIVYRLADVACFDLSKLKDDYGKALYNNSEYKMDEAENSSDMQAAILCTHIGRAMTTMYSPNSSGASEDHFYTALKDNMKLPVTRLNTINLRNAGYTDSQIDKKVQDFLASYINKGWPVIAVGWNHSQTAGHYWVVDGIVQGKHNGKDVAYCHYNMGGGPNGSGSGWFLLVHRDPTLVYKYTYDRQYFGFDFPALISPLDVNNDGYINMSDVTAIINAFKTNIEPSWGYRYRYTGLPIRPTAKSTPDDNNHEYVDFKLPSGTLWATLNIGAEAEEDAGNYFSWGETKTSKTKYEWGTYEHGTKNNKGEYVIKNIGRNICGNTKYDAARALWGNPWQMPTYDDFKELQDNCSFSIEKINDICCIEVARKIPGSRQAGRQAFYEQYTGKPYYYKDEEGNLRITEEAHEFMSELLGARLIIPLGGHIYISDYYGKDTNARLWIGEIRDPSTGEEWNGSHARIAYYDIFAKGISPNYIYEGREDVNFDGKLNFEDVNLVINRILNK